jgi:hypothetical protein
MEVLISLKLIPILSLPPQLFFNLFPTGNVRLHFIFRYYRRRRLKTKRDFCMIAVTPEISPSALWQS